jgi:hypothetical protein
MAIAALLIGGMAGAISFVAAWLLFDLGLLTAFVMYICAGFGSTVLTFTWAATPRRRKVARPFTA